jgi:excisionase family DNA binding protein
MDKKSYQMSGTDAYALAMLTTPEHKPERATLTVDEAGTLLGLSRSTAYRAVQAGQLPAIRVGRRWLIPRAAIERLLASAETGAGP